jgi:hypothetical protein
MQEVEKQSFTADQDFVLSDGDHEIQFINEKVNGAYAIKDNKTKDILATINALNGNVHSPSSFFHRSPEKNKGVGIDFALSAAVYLGLIKEPRYRDAFPVDMEELSKVGFCYGREYDPKSAIRVTDFEELYD